MRARIIKMSDDKQIILLNKGSEDGFKEKHTATFHTHNKKVFRAEVIKLSPLRSVWQIYRFYDRDFIKPDYALEVRSASFVEKIDTPKRMTIEQVEQLEKVSKVETSTKPTHN